MDSANEVSGAGVQTYQSLRDDGSRRRPGKDLDLARGVDQHVPAKVKGHNETHGSTSDHVQTPPTFPPPVKRALQPWEQLIGSEPQCAALGNTDRWLCCFFSMNCITCTTQTRTGYNSPSSQLQCLCSDEDRDTC